MSDQGTEFVNKVVDQASILLQIRRVVTAPYHPRADGLAENQVASIKDMLSAYVSVFQDDWDDYLATVAHFYRTTVNSATGVSPYFMLYGRECQQPDELWIRAFNDLSQQGETSVTDYVRGLAESMSLIWELVARQSEQQAQVRNDNHNKSIRNIASFKQGDRVWLEQPPPTVFVSQDDHEKYKVKKSFQNRYVGPYTVVKRISPITYILNVGGKTQHHTVDRMKPYNHRRRQQVEEKAEGKQEEVTNIGGVVEVKRKRGRPKLTQIVQNIQETIKGKRKRRS
jgi:hypothetical protein